MQFEHGFVCVEAELVELFGGLCCETRQVIELVVLKVAADKISILFLEEGQDIAG